ncbi:VOC family protein [Streptomyces neyagawaensis]|uniref:VOC family protein n=1 Tax=Streptomyces neyagawaensis TaxID=42238 RepID=UPI0006E1E056|nr:VOC family protein [Streptomyces neyagawaensis]MCL6731806.1 VOC family protein [Streptomyces neyagawaensis]MDE1683362.1 VOC family protein [Streptomyces neyagawaensis]
MDLNWEQVVVDAADPVALGRWWAEALGWVVVNDTPEEYEIRPEPDRVPGLLFTPVPEAKTVKNRLHLDFRPVDQAAEVSRLLALGARHADVGQGDESWVVLMDPEGNEFCVLSGRRS